MVDEAAAEKIVSSQGRLANKRKGCILVIDQDDSSSEFLSFIIKLMGCEFRLVKSVEQAMELLEQTTFDLLITDLHLPHSQEFLVANLEKHSQMQTIVMVQQRQVFFEAMRLPNAVFIQKPFNFDDIVQKIHQAMHHFNVQQVEQQIQRLRHEIFKF